MQNKIFYQPTRETLLWQLVNQLENQPLKKQQENQQQEEQQLRKQQERKQQEEQQQKKNVKNVKQKVSKKESELKKAKSKVTASKTRVGIGSKVKAKTTKRTMSTTVEKPTKQPSKVEKKSKEAVTTSISPKASSQKQYTLDPSSVASSSFAGISMLGIKPYDLKESETYMNDAQLKHFKVLLLKWKQMLMEEVDQTVSHLRHEAPNLLADPNDRATREENLFFELRARNREGKLLKKIEEALEKIERGEYGFCDVCGIEIGIRRLEARPTANLCIDCKTYDEIKEKQQGG